MLAQDLNAQRISSHPIVKFDRGKEATIVLEGKPVKAYENETIAAALYANGVRIFGRSLKYHRPRGFFCAIGRCSSCMMEVDGIPNVRTCVAKVRDGMSVRRLNGYPSVDHDLMSLLNRFSYISLSKGFPHKKLTRPAFLRNFYLNTMANMAGLGRLPKNIDGMNLAEREKIDVEVAVIGGGPAGLSAALEAGRLCKSVVILEDKDMLGGQLVKQTHRFFGDARHYAGVRGIRIAERFRSKVAQTPSIRPLTSCWVFGIYDGREIGAVCGDRLLEVRAKKIIIATGAYERTLIFEENDLPGVFGGGGVQTLMNTYAVKPGSKALVIGAGNVGLILTYQLLQSGVNVTAIVEALPRIGGYYVHAAKVRRYGVPIYTSHSVIRALGKKKVEGAVIAQLDEKWNFKPGTERRIDCDTICVTVGLNPTYELVQQSGARLSLVPDLGGFVPMRTRCMEVSEGVYVAGDLAGIEEATTAMLEGQIAGIHAAQALGYGSTKDADMLEALLSELEEERAGPFEERIRKGLEKVVVKELVAR